MNRRTFELTIPQILDKAIDRFEGLIDNPDPRSEQLYGEIKDARYEVVLNDLNEIRATITDESSNADVRKLLRNRAIEANQSIRDMMRNIGPRFRKPQGAEPKLETSKPKSNTTAIIVQTFRATELLSLSARLK